MDLGSEDYAFNISRLDSTRSIRGRIPSSLEMAKDSSSMVIAFSLLPECGGGYTKLKSRSISCPREPLSVYQGGKVRKIRNLAPRVGFEPTT